MKQMSDKEFHRIKLGELRKGNLLILEKLRKKKPLTVSYITNNVSRKMGVNPDVLSRNTRQKDIVRTRQLIYNLAYTNLKISYKDLGEMVGDKDHATVLHSVKAIKNMVDTDKDFRIFYNQIKHNILNER